MFFASEDRLTFSLPTVAWGILSHLCAEGDAMSSTSVLSSLRQRKV